MSTTYKGPDGRLYRVSEAPGIRGTYRIEYLDPACSVAYKQLPGYNDNANREEVVALLGKLAKDRGLVQAVVEDSPMPAWAVNIAKEFVDRAWVQELEHFSAACFQASSKAQQHAGGTCGPGFADASPKGIRLWRPGAGDVTYTWAKFVQACKEMGIQPAPEEATADPAADPAADPCATCLCNTCADDNCDNAPGCYKDKDACAQTHNTAKCDDYRPKGAPAPATDEPQEIVDESSDQDIPAATLTTAPATEIAAPAFDYSGLDKQTVTTLHSAENMIRNARKDYIIKVADAVGMAHDELVRNSDGHNQHTEETFVGWCQSVGLSKSTAYQLLQVSNLLCSSTPNEQKVLQQASSSLLYAAAKPSAPAELVEAVKAGDITSHKQYKELEAQLKAAEAAREAAEKKAQGLKASYNTAHANEQYNIDLRKKAQEAVEDLKQKLYRRNEELAAKDQELNAALDQQGAYISKLRELEKAPKDVAVEQPSEADIERWRREGEERARAEMARPRQTPLSANNVRPMACDLANSVTALYNTFLLAACELHGDEYAQCAAPLIAALQDALTGLQGAVNEHNATTYKEDEDFE